MRIKQGDKKFFASRISNPALSFCTTYKLKPLALFEDQQVQG